MKFNNTNGLDLAYTRIATGMYKVKGRLCTSKASNNEHCKNITG